MVTYLFEISHGKDANQKIEWHGDIKQVGGQSQSLDYQASKENIRSKRWRFCQSERTHDL